MIHYITTTGVGNAWVGNELRIMRRHRVPFVLHCLQRPAQTFFQSLEIQEIDRLGRAIYPIRPGALALSLLLAPLLFRGRFLRALANALLGPRESLRVRLRVLAHLLVACHWARGLRREPVSAIHSQWIHSCGSVGMYGAWLLGVPFSFTGHATDLFRDRAALVDKIRRAEFIACISSFHRELYLAHGAQRQQLRIVYCGIDTEQFQLPRAAREDKGSFRILSSGRLVEKKGFADLIAACRILRDHGLDFECQIGGSGPLEAELRQQIAREGLQERVAVTGQPLMQEEVSAFMHGGDVFCLPCVWAADGDVDGLPQMLMEAMACGLPVVSTRLVGIPDLVVDGETGLLVEAGRPDQLAETLLRVLHDPALRERLAAAGRRKVEKEFNLRTCVAPLIEYFRSREGLA
jgi:glycosyltransferase involved in cell wall biosynthesis